MATRMDPRPSYLDGCTFSSDRVYISCVDLSSLEKGQETAQYLAHHGQRHPDVTSLQLIYCKTGGDGCGVFAKIAIPHYPNLRFVNLYGNSIGDEGAVTMSEALDLHCPHLEQAQFANNQITDVGFGGMCEKLPALALKQLGVHNNQVTTIPSAFARFSKLKQFGTFGDEWVDWKPTGCWCGDAVSALALARKKQEQQEEQDELDNTILIKSAAKAMI